MRRGTMTIRSAFIVIAVATLAMARAAAAASNPASAGIVHILSQQPLAGQPGTDVTVHSSGRIDAAA
jgi:hypothetical protein